MAIDISDRRREPRVPVCERVEILFEDPLPAIVEVELNETSERGFRVSHDSQLLVPGLDVRLRRDGAVQQARVIWTHILEGRRVSGCLLL
jgi:hypothetical protein